MYKQKNLMLVSPGLYKSNLASSPIKTTAPFCAFRILFDAALYVYVLKLPFVTFKSVSSPIIVLTFKRYL